MGLILAFTGAIELKLFGAQIYVADLVGIAMVRLMAAIMTGIVMAGRTGGAFAAQLGTMQVNEEIDVVGRWSRYHPWSFWCCRVNGGLGSDDASTVPLCQFHGDTGGYGGSGMAARYQPSGILS